MRALFPRLTGLKGFWPYHSQIEVSQLLRADNGDKMCCLNSESIRDRYIDSFSLQEEKAELDIKALLEGDEKAKLSRSGGGLAISACYFEINLGTRNFFLVRSPELSLVVEHGRICHPSNAVVSQEGVFVDQLDLKLPA